MGNIEDHRIDHHTSVEMKDHLWARRIGSINFTGPAHVLHLPGLTPSSRPYPTSRACDGHGDLPTDSATPELCLLRCPSTPMSIPQHWQPKSSNRRQPPQSQLHSHQHMSNICDVPCAVLPVNIASCLFTARQSEGKSFRQNFFLARLSHSVHRLAHYQVRLVSVRTNYSGSGVWPKHDHSPTALHTPSHMSVSADIATGHSEANLKPPSM
ncbi:uncharacterized protein B0T23DRAFT_134245 [Neurospora hispaniola]|uniref:Uncharacterized protein n=1 Tax=Neurospora hispaniola TaxID=588809 RepID=A0AAJ0MQY5_9PEZI|nr:hypothetical protein B0T23DRAFT_134245 [Neurospora hispaniola]